MILWCGLLCSMLSFPIRLRFRFPAATKNQTEEDLLLGPKNPSIDQTTDYRLEILADPAFSAHPSFSLDPKGPRFQSNTDDADEMPHLHRPPLLPFIFTRLKD